MESITRERVVERFLRFVSIDTQSAEDIFEEDGKTPLIPSTKKQRDLAVVLEGELVNLGLEHVMISDRSYVTARLPSNLPEGTDCPTIGLIAHIDTSASASGENVNPIQHHDYDGSDIKLDGVTINVEENPELKNYIGDTIITSDGTTLLGADDKAGIAEILTTFGHLTHHPEILHGDIVVCFNPDEETGHGTDYFPGVDGDTIYKSIWGADLAYTIDGEGLGTVEDETFNASKFEITIKGRPVHPGYAKGKGMIDPTYVAADILEKINSEFLRPEESEKRKEYVWARTCTANETEGKITGIIRSFDATELRDMEGDLRERIQDVQNTFGAENVELTITPQYSNMKENLDKHPEAIRYANQAIETICGMEPIRKPIRGGTDGSMLTLKGLPTPNIFGGGYNFHGPMEYIPVSNMVKAVNTLVELVQLPAREAMAAAE